MRHTFDRFPDGSYRGYPSCCVGGSLATRPTQPDAEREHAAPKHQGIEPNYPGNRHRAADRKGNHHYAKAYRDSPSNGQEPIPRDRQFDAGADFKHTRQDGPHPDEKDQGWSSHAGKEERRNTHGNPNGPFDYIPAGFPSAVSRRANDSEHAANKGVRAEHNRE